ncbi:hypothetical protein EBZ37_01650, partial [bacterium]|nr:hypothetical protein [bacterium]
MTKFPILIATFCLMTTACNVSARKLPNSADSSKSSTSSITQASQSGTGSQGPVLQITNISQSKSSDGKKFYLNITIAAPTEGPIPTNMLSSFCAPGPSCLCRVVWNETNTTTPGATVSSDLVSVPFVRTAYSQLSTVQASFAQCEVPQPYQVNEIGLNQEMQIDIVPSATQSISFSTNKVIFKRPSETIDTREASFID